MATWEEWIQNVGGNLIDKAATAEYSQPYEIQRLRLEQLGQMGYYTEGQPGTLPRAGTVAGLPTSTLLLIGGAVVLFMFMKD
jgi:hypothetical protein